jgi:UDP-glucose 4-epimerase
MRALILGGNGFIGSHVVDALLVAGHKVRVFDRGSEMFRSPLQYVDYRIASFTDVPALAEALEGIDVVFHFISTTVPSTSNLDPISDIEGNLINTVQLLQLMVQKDVRRIVYLSSGGTVYGIPEVIPIPVSHSLKPICSYGVVKVAIENYLLMFQSLHGIEPIILRVSNPYGERQGHQGIQGVIGTFLQKVLHGEHVVIWGDGSVVRDFIYVGDLANICVQAANGACGIYNVGSGYGASIKQVLGCVETATGMELQVEYKPPRNFDIPSVILDISDTQKQFHWNPNIDLLFGIKRTWSWVKERDEI